MPYFKELQDLKTKHRANIRSIAVQYFGQFKAVCTGKYEEATIRQLLTEVSGMEVSKDFMESAR